MFEQGNSNGKKIALSVNAFVEAILILIAFVGNFLLMYIFCQKTYRKNPSHVLIIYSSLVDNSVLVFHFFEVKYHVFFLSCIF